MQNKYEQAWSSLGVVPGFKLFMAQGRPQFVMGPSEPLGLPRDQIFILQNVAQEALCIKKLLISLYSFSSFSIQFHLQMADLSKYKSGHIPCLIKTFKPFSITQDKSQTPPYPLLFNDDDGDFFHVDSNSSREPFLTLWGQVSVMYTKVL